MALARVEAATVFDVAARILQLRGPMTTMKLQKLVYYSQAWHLAWTGRPLFAAPIEAWKNGPVCPELFRAHRGRYSVSDIPSGDPAALTPDQDDSVRAVLDAYGPLGSGQLSAMTHSERPWLDARPSGSVITHEAMRDFYSGLQQGEARNVDELDWSGW